jgi:hypothetical protein
MRGGIHVDQRSLTGGVEGLGRLIKAYLSAGWVLGSMREWADDPVCLFTRLALAEGVIGEVTGC